MPPLILMIGERHFRTTLRLHLGQRGYVRFCGFTEPVQPQSQRAVGDGKITFMCTSFELIEHRQLTAIGSVDGELDLFLSAKLPNGTAPDIAQKQMPCGIVEKMFCQCDQYLVF
jgi:hypothetical protein